ncbi:hypothetical protein C4K02_1848 [Pseudomonas synxantha]|nr:hypothetical protein C4K02_1848 [Pseudomonas synxantha]
MVPSFFCYWKAVEFCLIRCSTKQIEHNDVYFCIQYFQTKAPHVEKSRSDERKGPFIKCIDLRSQP